MAVFKFPLKKFNRKVFKVTSMSVFFKAEQLRKQPKRPVQSPGYAARLHSKDVFLLIAG